MNKPLWLIVSHDAGGAEVISSWIRKQKEIAFHFLLEGPAEEIFSQKLGQIKVLTRSVLKDINIYNFVLTGTSWASDLEKIVINIAKESKVNVAAYIDHWVNYKERFFLNKKELLPDQIWVGDEEALNIAKLFFPSEILRFVKNQYFEDIKEVIAKINTIPSGQDDLRILYVCEPILEHSIKEYGHPNYWGYTEFEAMENFFSKLNELDFTKRKMMIKIRLHPSEKFGKYDHILDSYQDYKIDISNGTSLLEDCAWSQWLVGCESMAMVVGLLCKRSVFSSIPGSGISCRLPHKAILNVKNISTANIAQNF